MALREVEAVLDEFFASTSSPGRKKEIESTLNAFRAQPGAYGQCLEFLQNTKSQYVQWFATSVCEDVVVNEWPRLQRQDKNQQRELLFDYLQANHKVLPTFVSGKLCKILVDIAKHDWPDHFPDFVPRLLRLLGNSDTAVLSVLLLKTLAEEMVSTREIVSARRRRELNAAVNAALPELLSAVTSFLGTAYEGILSNAKDLSAAGGSCPFASDVSPNLLSPARQFDHVQFPNLGQSPTAGRMQHPETASAHAPQPITSLSPDVELKCRLALEFLQSLLSWIVLSDHVNSTLLDVLLRYAQMCDPPAVRLGVTAMNCVNEIVGRNYIPHDFLRFLAQTFKQVLDILKRFTNSSAKVSLGDLDDVYRAKFTDFIGLVVQNHIQRADSEMFQFPLVEFTSLFFQYTFLQQELDSFRQCLRVWENLLEYLTSKKVDSSEARPLAMAHPVRKHQQCLLSLVEQVIGKVQPCGEHGQLDEEIAALDRVRTNAEGLTELDTFLNEIVEVIERVAELFPDDVLAALTPVLATQMNSYYQIQDFVTSKGENDEISRFCENLAITYRVFGRLTDVFVRYFELLFEPSLAILTKLVENMIYSTRYRLFMLSPQLLNVAAQLFATIKAYLYWLSAWQDAAQGNQTRLEQLNGLYMEIVRALVELLSSGAPEPLLDVSAGALCSITSLLRAPFFLELPAVAEYASAVHADAIQLPRRCKVLVYQTFTNAFGFPPKTAKVSEDEWKIRSEKYHEFMKGLTGPYLELALLDAVRFQENGVRLRVQHTAVIITGVVDLVAEESAKQKQLVYEAVKECLMITLDYLRTYTKDHDTLKELLQMLLAIVRTLKRQTGVPYITEVLTNAINLVAGDALTQILREEVNGAGVLEMVLRLLASVIDESGSMFEQLLPGIILFCVDEMHMKLSEATVPHSDTVEHILPAYYDLVHKILLRFTYFFPVSGVRQIVGNAGISSQRADAAVEHEGQLLGLLQVIAGAFMKPGIEGVRSNIAVLKSLNEKFGLYKKDIFKNAVMFPLLEILLVALVNKTHDLLRDDIISAFYEIASVDIDAVLSQFIPVFLSRTHQLGEEAIWELRNEIEGVRDRASHMDAIKDFVHDYAYFNRIHSQNITALQLFSK